MSDQPSADELLHTLAFRLDCILNGEEVETNPTEVKRVTSFVLILFPFGDTSGKCRLIGNGVKKEDVLRIFKRQIEHAENPMGDKPFDPAANMVKINDVLHELRDGKITRDECRQRLVEECHVADYNLDPLLNAYDPKDGSDDEE
jgi:hypothetical protein